MSVRNLLKRAGLGEAAVLLALLIVVSGAWGFIELAEEMLEGDTQGFDEWTLRSLRSANDPKVPLGPEWLQAAARDITSMGSVSVLVLVTVCCCGFLVIRRKFSRAGLVLGAALSGEILSNGLKHSFTRERPLILQHLDQVATASFPSGHAMLSAVVYLTLGALLMRFAKTLVTKIYIICCAFGLAGLIGITRVYLGVHYPTDVLAGWSAGLVWAVLWWLIARYFQRHHVRQLPGTMPPHAKE